MSLGDRPIELARTFARKLYRRFDTTFRRTWTALVPDEASEAEYRRVLDVQYQVADPFKMASAKEQFRFAETNRLLAAGLIAPQSRVGSILEIGCGEGHQSEYFSRLCDRVTGIDTAADAVGRGRGRVPGAELIVGDLRDQSWANDQGRFDIVTACEVIYYFKDIPGILRQMSRLGRACFVTYLRPAAYLVEGPLKAMPRGGRAAFVFEDVEWRAAWWRAP